MLFWTFWRISIHKREIKWVICGRLMFYYISSYIINFINLQRASMYNFWRREQMKGGRIPLPMIWCSRTLPIIIQVTKDLYACLQWVLVNDTCDISTLYDFFDDQILMQWFTYSLIKLNTTWYQCTVPSTSNRSCTGTARTPKYPQVTCWYRSASAGWSENQIQILFKQLDRGWKDNQFRLKLCILMIFLLFSSNFQS